MQKTLFITHIDLDGVAPIILNNYYGIKYDKVIHINYDDIEDRDGNLKIQDFVCDFEEYENLVMVDISVSENFFGWIEEVFPNYVIIDHHETTDWLIGKPNCYIDKTMCGTKGYYKYLQQEKGAVPTGRMDSFIELVTTYDTWRDKSELWEDAQNLNRLFWNMIKFYQPMEKKFNHFIAHQLTKLREKGEEDKPFYFTAAEQVRIEDVKGVEEDEVLLAQGNMKTFIDDEGITYLIYHGSKKISHVCNKLLLLNPEASYVININTFNKKNFRKKEVNGRLSVRSTEESGFDVTTLEGIRGHVNAGGGEVGIQFITKLWMNKNVHLSKLGETDGEN